MDGFGPETTRAQAMQRTKEFFNGKNELITLVERSLEYLGPESDSQPFKFLVNIETL